MEPQTLFQSPLAVASTMRENNSQNYNRRTILKTLAASSVGIGTGVAVASGNAAATTQELHVDAEIAQKKLEEMDSKVEAGGKDTLLFKVLTSEGYLSGQPSDEFSTHQLSSNSKRGGVERLQVNGDNEQFLFHKYVNGGRLEINLNEKAPMTAVFYPKDATETIEYLVKNDYKPQIQAQGCNTTACQCDDCVYCCGGWAFGDAFYCYQDCPNCWIADCHRVVVGCC
jgi:hypothetical protein